MDDEATEKNTFVEIYLRFIEIVRLFFVTRSTSVEYMSTKPREREKENKLSHLFKEKYHETKAIITEEREKDEV